MRKQNAYNHKSCPRGRIAHSSRRETDVERGGQLCLFVARSALSLALQALNGTPQSEMWQSCLVASCMLSIALAANEYLPPSKGYNYDVPKIPFPTRTPPPPPIRTTPPTRPNTYVPPPQPTPDYNSSPVDRKLGSFSLALTVKENIVRKPACLRVCGVNQSTVLAWTNPFSLWPTTNLTRGL
ncbi:jg10479 [Pararge aegeria aegeria]|uniref:Jg10479 protein n=1 Tax=Pararge aegeria aegeria TaxID=348720 RepID=A0A8S4RER8_9NEOP|nr:jg10479 [Pararge aegeria aegeria]